MTTRTGLLVARFGQEALVESQGAVIRAQLKKNLVHVVPGDTVSFETQPGSHLPVVTECAARNNLITRSQGPHKTKPMAANVDYFLLVIAPAPPTPTDLIDSVLVLAKHFKVTPLIAFNKCDSLSPEALTTEKNWLAPFEAIGVPIFYISALENSNVDALEQQLAGHCTMLLGPSGVGKSTLAQGLVGDDSIRVGELSYGGKLGKHTTTVTHMYPLRAGGHLMDSPGIRELGLHHVDKAAIMSGFPEIQDLARHCEFTNCTHHEERGCAVEAAVQNGSLALARHQSFLRFIQ